MKIVVSKPKGGDKLRLILDRLAYQAKHLDIPLLAVGLVVRDFAVMNIKTQGGSQPWTPSKKDGHTGIDTGNMWQSIGISQSGPGNVVVGTNVRYAKWFQEGTGIFAGHSEWVIKPKNARALSFTVGGDRVFAKEVVMKGQPARPFLYIDQPLQEKIFAKFTEHLNDLGGLA